MILKKTFVKMNIFKENPSSQIISHRKTKRCATKLLKNFLKSMNPIFLFLSNRFESNLKPLYRNAKVKSSKENCLWITSSLALEICANLSRQQSHVLGLSIKKGKKQRKRRQEELATNVRKIERGNLLKLSKEGENLVSQTRAVPVKKDKLKEETLM